MTDPKDETDAAKIEALWQEYLEAAHVSGTTETGLDLYDIEDMNDAAHALYQMAKQIAGADHG